MFLEPEVARILQQAQAAVWRDAARIFLFDLPDIVAISPRVKGFVHRADERIGILNLSR